MNTVTDCFINERRNKVSQHICSHIVERRRSVNPKQVLISQLVNQGIQPKVASDLIDRISHNVKFSVPEEAAAVSSFVSLIVELSNSGGKLLPVADFNLQKRVDFFIFNVNMVLTKC